MKVEQRTGILIIARPVMQQLSSLDDVVVTIARGTAAGSQTLIGDENDNDVFRIDSGESDRQGADIIRNFQTGRDKIELPAASELPAAMRGATADDPIKVWWRVEPDTGVVTLRSSNNATGDNILAVIENVSGSISASDFVGNNVTLSA